MLYIERAIFRRSVFDRMAFFIAHLLNQGGESVLAKVRKQAGMTQEQVAKALGVSRSYICKLERRAERLTIETAIKLARVYGVPPGNCCSPFFIDPLNKTEVDAMNEASRRGRANKRAGYYYEKQLEKLFTRWGLECWRVPMSGALKKEGLDGDLRVSVYGRVRKVENKKRDNLERFYKLVEGDQAVVIEGFCVLVPQDAFYDLINAKKPGLVVTIPDRQFKGLHGFFDQDNADLVTMVSPHKPFIFALSLSLWDELYQSCYDDEVVA